MTLRERSFAEKNFREELKAELMSLELKEEEADEIVKRSIRKFEEGRPVKICVIDAVKAFLSSPDGVIHSVVTRKNKWGRSVECDRPSILEWEKRHDWLMPIHQATPNHW